MSFRIIVMRACSAPFFLCLTAAASAQLSQPVMSLAQKERPALIETLKELTAIESGSHDIEGLDRIADVLAGRLKALGGKVEMLDADQNTYRQNDSPKRIGRMVRATFTGTGDRRILLLAHMDTVYPRGTLLKQPFRVEGERAYGLAIADDRHGLAVILHTIAMLNAMAFRDYGTLTVLFNADEEVGSVGSRDVITKLGKEHDAIMSFEGGGTPETPRVSIATSGSANALIIVHGKASHSGNAPQLGVNAVDELAYQILQNRDLSDPSIGLRANFTLASGGVVRNMIPPEARAVMNIRVHRVADLDGIERKLRERIKNKLLPASEVELVFERNRPPLEARPVSRAMAEHAAKVYAETGRKLTIPKEPSGGGTDAAYAGLDTKAPVVEGFGLQGFGAHSQNAEYILLDSIEPRLYLATRMIMDISHGKISVAP